MSFILLYPIRRAQNQFSAYCVIYDSILKNLGVTQMGKRKENNNNFQWDRVEGRQSKIL